MSSIKPKKPQRGEKVLQSLYDSVCQIIDFLPSLQVVGDNKTVKVDSFGSGKTITAIKPANSTTSSSGSSQQQVFLGIITNGSNISNVTARLSTDNGNTFLGQEVNLNLTGVSLASEIKVGTVIIVYKGLANIVGGSQNL